MPGKKKGGVFGFLKGAVKKVGGLTAKIVKKAAPVMVGGVVGGILYAKRKAIGGGVKKGVEWIGNRIKDLKSKGYTATEAEKMANEEAAQPDAAGLLKGPLKWILIGLGVVALALFLIFVVFKPKR
jgi:hypothetical protein